MNTCIYYSPEAFTTTGPRLMGRNAAGESFLNGFISYSSVTEFWAQVQMPEHGKEFTDKVRALGREEPVQLVDKSRLSLLEQAEQVYYPGPSIGEMAWQRGAFGHGAWSLCGITHTTSSAVAMDHITSLVTSPVQPWDALICTSTAVKNNVTRLLEIQADFLKDRLGISKLVLPQLPVIPLGINCNDFEFTAEQKSKAKACIGAGEDVLVVLFLGRLSFHAKAHPLVMYQALEKAASSTGKQVVLVQCGWYDNESIKKAYQEAAELACPSVRICHLDGRNQEDRQTAWASADIFCSLADNIQETFGIVPIEAMAAGLPVVVTDWDGYRDTVRDGIDGFRVPTIMPQPGLGGDLAYRHAVQIDSYDRYCGYTCSLIAVEIESTTKAFEKLFNSLQLRQQMGEAGRERARGNFDWAVIIPRYESLWAELAQLRRSQARNIKPLAHPWPARMDPFYSYASYPSSTLKVETKLALANSDVGTTVQLLQSFSGLSMVNFAKPVLSTQAECEAVLQSLKDGPLPAAELVKPLNRERQILVFRSLTWLLKLGLLKVCS